MTAGDLKLGDRRELTNETAVSNNASPIAASRIIKYRVGSSAKVCPTAYAGREAEPPALYLMHLCRDWLGRQTCVAMAINRLSAAILRTVREVYRGPCMIAVHDYA